MSKTSQSLAWKSSWHFRDTNCTGFPAKWWRRNERRNSILMTRRYPDLGSASDWSCLVGFASTNQKHYPDLASHASSVWNFCAGFSDVISRGNQWCRREMSAVFSSYSSSKVANFKIKLQNFQMSFCKMLKKHWRTKWKYSQRGFIWMITPKDFVHRLKS